MTSLKDFCECMERRKKGEMSMKEYAEKLREFCEENPNWFEDGLLLNEDPVELARYGLRSQGHMDESILLGKIEAEESEDFDYEF